MSRPPPLGTHVDKVTGIALFFLPGTECGSPPDAGCRKSAEPGDGAPTQHKASDAWDDLLQGPLLSAEKTLSRIIPGPHDPAEMEAFLESFLYREEAFFIDEILEMDVEKKYVAAQFDTNRPLPFAAAQRVDPRHPAHVSAAELLMATGSLGCVHAWFFHGCRWDEGWAGFGNRIHRADFKRLATIGPPLRLESQETRTRVGPARVVIRYAFDFWQEEELVYRGDQTAMFFKGKIL